jgi:hypothetical protein
MYLLGQFAVGFAVLQGMKQMKKFVSPVFCYTRVVFDIDFEEQGREAVA